MNTLRITILACLFLAGCVPVPFKPSATVSQTAVGPEQTAPRLALADERSEAHSVAKAIRHGEPRIVLVDAASWSARVGTAATLPEVLAAAHEGHPELAADYLLSVGEPTNHQLHDTGAAAPFLFVPSVVGYEKIQSIGTLSATLVDLKEPQSLEVLCASSTYSEVAAGLFYGVMTVAMPEAALRDALAKEVTHRLAVMQPAGTIRLLVLSQDPRSKDPKAPPARAAAGCSAGHIPGAVTAAAAP